MDNLSTDTLLEIINDGISELCLPAEPSGLYDPIRYSLEGGGKRLRPVLTLAAAIALGGSSEQAVNQAIGLEMFHNFTLLHDDVMDKADVRRGRPTIHRRWNESTAILSGDAMLTIATQLIAKAPDHHLRDALELFNRTAIEVYEGQQYDMDFEKRNNVTEAEYIEMIRLKTSVLIGCACKMGALMAGGDEQACKAMYAYGEWMGLAFQLQDDLLDTYGDPVIFGKQIGGDIINEKKTWLLITALNEAHDEVIDIFDEKLDADDKIARVRAIYDNLNLADRCASLAQEYVNKAIEILKQVDMSVDAREFFIDLASKALKRNH